MADSIQKYWRSVRSIAAKLDPEAAERDANETDPSERINLERSTKEIWLVSKENEKTGGVGGKVVSAGPYIAARWIKDGTHELATDEQVRAHKRTLEQTKEQIEKEEADRKGVPTSKLLEALVSAQTAGKRAARGE